MNNTITIINNEYVHYVHDINLYKKEFCILKKQGIIKNDKFQDSIWTIKNENYKAYYRFNKLKFRSYIDILKAFCIERMKKKYDVHDLSKKVNYIIRIINYTNGFSDDCLELIKKDLLNNKFKSISEICIACVSFLSFIDMDNKYNLYLNLFKQYTRKTYKIRELPDYQSIIEFDYILNEYFDENDNKNNKDKYFPIFLWWKITSVIPMRPLEFLTLRKDCCYKENGCYYLNIYRRNKDKTNPEVKTTLQKLKVNEEIYSIIDKYNCIIESKCKIKDREYLLSYELYNKNSIRPKMALSLKSNINFMEMRQLHTLLKNFYDKVIYIKSTKKIEKIKLGDTRHLAFCNLMLQGLDPITIAKMGFHKKLSTQIAYEQHLDTFVYSYTYILANKIKQIKNQQGLVQLNNMFHRDEVILRSKLFQKDKAKYIKIENGYCMDEKFPLNCGNLECIDCECYILENLNSDNVEYIDKKIKTYLLKIKEDLIAMRYYAHKTMNIKNNESFEHSKNTLLFMSNSIQRQIAKSANMIAQL